MYHISQLCFPQLDALHVLDASAHFDAGHATHNLLIDAQVSNRGCPVSRRVPCMCMSRNTLIKPHQ